MSLFYPLNSPDPIFILKHNLSLNFKQLEFCLREMELKGKKKCSTRMHSLTLESYLVITGWCGVDSILSKNECRSFLFHIDNWSPVSAGIRGLHFRQWRELKERDREQSSDSQDKLHNLHALALLPFRGQTETEGSDANHSAFIH